MSPPATRQFSGIFISYRRDDSSGHAGRLFDRLSARFGEEQVFMDIDQIEPGEDFVQVIESAVSSCEILLALIGRNWLTSRDDGGRRLDNPNDFVRLEITAALVRGIPVIPVLVQGARMPRPQDLPEDLLALSRRHALELSDLRWKHDIEQLTGVLEKVLDRRREARRQAAQQEEERKRLEEEARQRQEAEHVRLQEEEIKRHLEAKKNRQRRNVESTPMPFNKPLSTVSPEPAVAPVSDAARRSRPRLHSMSRVAINVIVSVPLVLCLLVAWWVMRGEQASRIVGQAINEQLTVPGITSSPHGVNEALVLSGMVYVPGGQFLMGNDAGDEYESPAHTVVVQPFFIDRHEVTNEEYGKFVKDRKHKPPPAWKDNGWYLRGEARYPVTGVTWEDAAAFALWARKRLPTEAEWEFAARGVSGRYYPWGNEWSSESANANGAEGGVVDVGHYSGESPFGVLDMVGNAWEWTATKLAPYPPKKNLPIKVKDSLMVIRGGSFAESREQATATYRGYLDARSSNNQRMGFRCVRSIATPAAL